MFRRRHFAEFVENMIEASNDLAAHEKGQGNRLSTLQRAVQFTCLVLLAHAQVLAANGKLDERVPLLLTMDAPKRSRLTQVSEETVRAFYSRFEEWLSDQLADRLAKGQPLSTAIEKKDPIPQPETPQRLHRSSVKAWLREFSGQDGKAPSDRLIKERIEHYDEAKVVREEEGIYSVLGETLARCYFTNFTAVEVQNPSCEE